MRGAIVASQDLNKSKELANTLDEKAHAKETIEAIKGRHNIMPAIYFYGCSFKEFLKPYARISRKN
ncbi:MAG: hypothetical protein U5K79_00410 [Cyclobacteriaceae bacterium]|nr:hypothetical protein [Cyclobacteriaceae bacterium]